MADSGADDRRRAERIEVLVRQIATIADASARARMEELVQALLELYGDGLARLLALTEQAPGAGDALAAFRLPVAVWREMIAHYFPNSAWIRPHKVIFDQLRAYRAAQSLPTWEAMFARLLEASHAEVGA